MEFSITVPGGWYQLPAPDDAVDEHWAETVAGLGVDDESASVCSSGCAT
jgi:hypothetical protein